MKTAEIKDLLKKDLLIVEAKDEKIAWAIIFQKYGVKAVSDYTLLGKPDEIKEEDARELVEETEMSVKLNSTKYKYRAYNSQLGFSTAKESLLSLIESEIFWDVNPASFDDNQDDPEIRREMRYRWELAEEKTFDRKRTLIFVKN